MSLLERIFRTRTSRIAAVALAVLACDQITKALVLRFLGYYEEKVVVPGFFKFVHWQNTGAAWSLFTGNNTLLAVIALVALVALFLARNQFHAHRLTGQLALGLVFGGIVGNLTDRLLPGRHAVVDFLHFYLQRRGGGEPLDFPAFNVADSAICTGVAIIFLINWRNESAPRPAAN